jgi:hypothetical protein
MPEPELMYPMQADGDAMRFGDTWHVNANNLFPEISDINSEGTVQSDGEWLASEDSWHIWGQQPMGQRDLVVGRTPAS